VTTAVYDLFLPDLLADFVPIKYFNVEQTQLDIEIFALPKAIRFNPLRLMYIQIQGWLHNSCCGCLETLRDDAEQNKGKVTLT